MLSDKIRVKYMYASFLEQSHISFSVFSAIFLLLLLIPIVLFNESFNSDVDIFSDSEAKSRVQMASCIGIGISFPILVDGLLDLSIKNLLKRWIYWGMFSSILIPSMLALVASLKDIPSLYIFSGILGLHLRYMFLIINTLAAEFDPFIKISIFAVSSIRIILLFLWTIALFHSFRSNFEKICEILIFISDVFMVFLLVYTFRLVKKNDPTRSSLKVYAFVLSSLLIMNLVTFLSKPSQLFSQLLYASKGSTSINVLKACMIAVATMLPNRLYRASAEELNRRYTRKRDFVRYVSHEVRTPLNAVYVGLHVLFQDLKVVTNNLEILSVIEDIRTSCNDAVNILDGILHFNEIDEGIAKIKPAAVKVKAFMSKVVRPFFNEATRMNVTLKYFDNIEDDSDPFYLIIDKLKIAMVMRSIIASSLHMSPMNGSVEVSLALVTKNTGPPEDLHSQERKRASTSKNEGQDSELMLRVTIRDSGAGIPKDSLATIFDDSAQFRPIDYQSGLGTALDLWIAKEYVHMHGGRIGIVSSGVNGDGCIFYVDLKIAQGDELDAVVEGSNSSSNENSRADVVDPLSHIELKHLVDESNISDDSKILGERRVIPSETTMNLSGGESTPSPKANSIATSPSDSAPTTHPPQKSSMKVIPGDTFIEGQKLSRALVVDDVASNRKMLGRVIQSRFHQIDYAENGKIAVDLVQESEQNEEMSRFNIIFMDCNMPVMDGIEATKRIRALGFRGRIFGVTGNALGEDMEEFLQSGLDQVLTKPLNMDKLIQAMKDVESKQQSCTNEAPVHGNKNGTFNLTTMLDQTV